MAAFDWEGHRKHRKQVIKDVGQWVGLLDENGIPLLDMPPIIELQAPSKRHTPAELTLKVAVASNGIVHPCVGHLVAGGLGGFGQLDGEGRLQPNAEKTRFICIEREDTRHTYKVSHCVAAGGVAHPDTLEVHGLDVKDLLNGIPAPSFPGSWRDTKKNKWRSYEMDWSATADGQGRFTTPRYMRPVEFATRLDGFTFTGPATATIRKRIQASLEVVYAGIGLERERWPLIVSEKFHDDPVDDLTVVLSPKDGYILAEFGDTAKKAGVEITATMWLPGDDRDGIPDWVDRPIVVVDVFKGRSV